jgi:hypothetical protein
MTLNRKVSLGRFAAQALPAVSARQAAQPHGTAARKPVPCDFAWCPVHVEVV